MNITPKITFGMIVLNGEPFTRYNLRALYPFAHQIIVVEGASPYASGIASSDGHSIDGTLAVLQDFKLNEDPDDKVLVVTAEDEGYGNGFWPGEKTEQSQAYARRATGDWLWQVDVDEFYMPDDIQWICNNLLNNPEIRSVSFKQIPFWGSLDFFVDGWYLRHYGGEIFHRLFRWGPNYSYVTHRPPTVKNSEGIDLSKFGHIQGAKLINQNIYLYHYSLLFPHQVDYKSAYYSNVKWGVFSRMKTWAEQNYKDLRNPFRVHNTYQYPSWFEQYSGNHPPQVQAMWEDVQNRRLASIHIRSTNDIESLIKSHRYAIGKSLLKVAGPVVCGLQIFRQRLFSLFPKSFRLFVKRVMTKDRISNEYSTF